MRKKIFKNKVTEYLVMEQPHSIWIMWLDRSWLHIPSMWKTGYESEAAAIKEMQKYSLERFGEKAKQKNKEKSKTKRRSK